MHGGAVLAWYEGACVELTPDLVLSQVAWMHGERPDLWPTWVAHVRQLLSLGRVDEARALAQQATDRFGLVAEVWLTRASVEAATGHPGGELDALERAVAAAPLETGPVLRLAAALEQGGDAARARAVLDRIVSGAPATADAALALARVEWGAGDRASAVARLKRTVALAPEAEGVWEALVGCLAEMGQKDDALALARSTADKRPWSAAMARCLARVASEAGDRAAALGACRLAIERDPRSIESHDLYASILAGLGEWTEALRACSPAVFGADVPKELRGRAAWIEMSRGNHAAAAAKLRAVLALDSNYTWGWAQLVECATALGDTAGRAVAAEQLARVAPRSQGAQMRLADARLAQGDWAGARASWERALALGGDAAAAIRLTRAALEDGDVEAGQRWAALVRARAGDGALPSETRVALSRDDRTGAIALFRRACAVPGAPMTGVVRNLLVCAGLGNEAYRVLSEEVAASPAPPVAIAWALTSLERADGQAEAWLFQADPRAEATRAAARAVIEHLARRGRGALVRWLGWRLPRPLRKAPEIRKAMKEATSTRPLLSLRVRRYMAGAVAALVVLGVLFGLAVGGKDAPSPTSLIAPLVYGIYAVTRRRQA